jgi:UDP-glucuronate 4-epimerase
MKYLITGSSGFIGYHVASRLLANNFEVIGVDNQNSYYDVNLKKAREKNLQPFEYYKFHLCDISDLEKIDEIVRTEKPDIVIHLAAQAGVRNSISDPTPYLESNLVGTFNILEIVRKYRIQHLLLASTSSVYGANTNMPFEEEENTDFPLSFYAATKKATEVMAHSYSHLYGCPITVFRFFTVYGPWGRPDMALFKFCDAMLKNKMIDVYNFGKMKRDFTYIEDLAKAIQLLSNNTPDLNVKNLLSSEVAPYRIVNIGNGNPENLMEFIRAIEEKLSIKAKINFLPLQAGDVPETFAETDKLYKLTGFRPNTPVKIGVANFIDWFLTYYRDE